MKRVHPKTSNNTETAITTPSAPLPSQAIQAAPKPAIGDAAYMAAVEEGKSILAKTKATIEQAKVSQDWLLGKLADGVTTTYGARSLETFAAEVDICVNRLRRCRSVYRAYRQEGKEAPAPILNFSALQELQAVENRRELIAENPAMTKQQARALREINNNKQTLADPVTKNNKGWWRDVLQHANEIASDAEFLDGEIKPEVMRDLRAVITSQQLSDLRKTEESARRIREWGENLLAEATTEPVVFLQAAE